MRRIISVRINASSLSKGRSHLELSTEIGFTSSGMELMASEWGDMLHAMQRVPHGTYIMLEIERSAQ